MPVELRYSDGSLDARISCRRAVELMASGAALAFGTGGHHERGFQAPCDR
jgi:hypothetical protein